MKPSRLLVVNCNISESITEVIDSAARAAADPSTVVITIAPTWGVASAEGYLDGHLASVAMLDVVAATSSRTTQWSWQVSASQAAKRSASCSTSRSWTSPTPQHTWP